MTPNVETELVGHTITYKGQTFTEDSATKYYIYNVDGEEVRALTKLKGSGEDSAREPAILHNLTGDIYIAPSPPRDVENSELILELKKSYMGEDYSYVFTDSTIETDGSGHPTLVKVTIAITDGLTVETIEPTIQVTAMGGSSEPVPFFNGDKRLRLTGISGDEKNIRIEILPSFETISEMPVTATFSTKPLIWLLWLSATAIVVGTLIALKH